MWWTTWRQKKYYKSLQFRQGLWVTDCPLENFKPAVNSDLQGVATQFHSFEIEQIWNVFCEIMTGLFLKDSKHKELVKQNSSKVFSNTKSKVNKEGKRGKPFPNFLALLLKSVSDQAVGRLSDIVGSKCC